GSSHSQPVGRENVNSPTLNDAGASAGLTPTPGNAGARAREGGTVLHRVKGGLLRTGWSRAFGFGVVILVEFDVQPRLASSQERSRRTGHQRLRPFHAGTLVD